MVNLTKLKKYDNISSRWKGVVPNIIGFSSSIQYYKVFGYELSLEDGKYFFVPDNESIFGGYKNCILDFSTTS